MLVALHQDRFAPALRHWHGDDLLCQTSVLLSGTSPLLAAQGEGVLVGAGDLEILGDVLGRLRHGVDAVRALHQRIDEAPADGGVENLRGAREGRLRLRHDEGRATHGLDAAGDHQVRLPSLDRPGRGTDRIETRAAKTIDRAAGNFDGQLGQQSRHAGDIAIVFTGLVGAAQDDVVQPRPVDAGMPFHQAADRQCGQIVGPDAGEGAAVAADRGADSAADEGFGHGVCSSSGTSVP